MWEKGRRLSSTIIASALDCATTNSINVKDFDYTVELIQAKRICITGFLWVRYLRETPVEIDEGYVITSLYLGRNDRHLFAISALRLWPDFSRLSPPIYLKSCSVLFNLARSRLNLFLFYFRHYDEDFGTIWKAVNGYDGIRFTEFSIWVETTRKIV